jgi:thioredoxin
MDFEKDVIEESKKTLVVVDFYADWCGPCKMLSPVITNACVQLNINLVKVNTEDHPEIAEQFKITSIPDLRLFSGGKEISQSKGFKPLNQIISWINSSI